MHLKIADKEIEKQTVLKKTAFQVDPLQIQYQGGQFNTGLRQQCFHSAIFSIGKSNKSKSTITGRIGKARRETKSIN
jgi:GH24 family phage-related lysozyme (muramidase)